jgi:hypothetical protein
MLLIARFMLQSFPVVLVRLLAQHRDVGTMPTVLFDEPFRLHEHAAGPPAAVEHPPLERLIATSNRTTWVGV